MSAEFFIARRYLFSKRKINLITIITAISVIGVTIGVAAMIIVLSVFNGFNQKVTNILVGFDPHIRIEPQNTSKLSNPDEIMSKINDSRIKYIAPFTLNKGMLITTGFNKVIFVKGIDPEKSENVSGLKNSVLLGKFDLSDDGDIGSILIGVSVAYRLKVNVGDTLTIVSPSGLENALTQFLEPVTKTFIIKGIFNAENKEYDSRYSYISIENAQKLFKLDNKVSGVEMRLDDINYSEQVKEQIQKNIGNEYMVQTWYDLHKDFYSILKVERWVAFIILSLIIAVASFNILASLTMTVIEKKRDIGILKAMGASDKVIRHIFLFEGLVVGLIGMFAGSGLGLLITLLQKYFGIYKLDSSVYLINSLPVELRITDFIFIPAAALILCLLAALYPSVKASKLDSVQSIRWE